MAREVGIIVKVIDAASGVFKAIGNAAKSASSIADWFRKQGASLFGGLKISATGFNQSLELMKKGFRLISGAITDVVNKALEFRKADDPMVKWFKSLGRESDRVKARIGDIILPIIKGVGDAFDATGDSVSKWLETNRKAIATDLLNILDDVGHSLIDKVAVGVNLVMKAWYGWRLIITGTRAALNSFFAWTMSGLSNVLHTLGEMSDFTGAKDLANQFYDAAKGAGILQRDFSKGADRAYSDLNGLVEAQTQFEKKIDDTRKSADKLFGAAIVSAHKEIEKSTVGATKSQDEMNKSLSEYQQISASIAADEAYYFEIAQKRRTQDEADEQARITAAHETAQAWAEAGASIADAFVTAAAAADDSNMAMQSGFKAALLAALDALRSYVIASITASAATGAAKTESWWADKGPVGNAIGVVAAGALFATIMAWMSKANFAGGGEVAGGVYGRDSVPAMLMPGERVLTVDENRTLSRFTRSVTQPRHGQSDNMVAHFAWGGNVGGYQSTDRVTESDFRAQMAINSASASAVAGPQVTADQFRAQMAVNSASANAPTAKAGAVTTGSTSSLGIATRERKSSAGGGRNSQTVHQGGGGKSGGGVTIINNINWSSMGLPSASERRRLALSLSRDLEQLQANGLAMRTT